jgi:hypothetical protein
MCRPRLAEDRGTGSARRPVRRPPIQGRARQAQVLVAHPQVPFAHGRHLGVVFHLWVATSNTRRVRSSVGDQLQHVAHAARRASSGSGRSSPALRVGQPRSMGRVTRSIMALNRSALSLKCQ